MMMLKRISTAFAALTLFGSLCSQVRTIEATAALKPEAPVTGENRLEVAFTEAGKPLAGLKLTASVEMTNMDMGTAHPPVKEVSPGRYVVQPMFLMNGPWRVNFVCSEPKFSVSWDFSAGDKNPWKPKKQIIEITTGSQPGAQNPPKGQTEYGSHGGHAASSMPRLAEKSTYTWDENMSYEIRTGFGKLEPVVRMMMLMMVGGSGFEGMKMAPIFLIFDEANFSEGGDNRAMGDTNSPFAVHVELASPKVGVNNVKVTIADQDGKPVEKAKVAATLAMTSMDMGTTSPIVKEEGGGNYSLKVNFSMAGSWRLTLTVTTTDQKPSTYQFDFDVK